MFVIFVANLIFWTFLAGCLVHWLIFLLFIKPKNIPDGPLVLPIIGNIWYFAFCTDYCQAMLKLHHRYGKAVTIFAGLSRKAMNVVIFDYKLTQHLQNGKIGEIISHRPEKLNEIRGVTEGIVWGQYPVARHLRAMVMKCFKEMGFSHGQCLIKPVEDEINRMFKSISNQCGKALNPEILLIEHFASSITIGAISRRLDLSNEEHRQVLNKAHGFFDATPLEMFLLPYLVDFSYLIKDKSAIAEKWLEQTMSKWLEEERLERTKGGLKINVENARDVFDVYLSSNPNIDQVDPHFMRAMVDTYFGAMETGATQLLWLIFYLAHQPDEQERIFNELLEQVGESSLPQPKHLNQCPKLQSYIEEMQRFSIMTTQGFPRRVATDVDIDGIELKQNDSVIFSWRAIQVDPEYWIDPDNFRPNRWLDPATGKFIQKGHTFQFGTGKRVCPGENIARNLVFCFIAAIIQRFQWKLASKPNFNGYKMNLLRRPSDFQVVFTDRY